MIKFAERFEATKSSEISSAAHKEIAPQKSSAVEGALDYWKNIFNGSGEISREIDESAVRDIYGYSDEDFSIDFTPSSELKDLT